LSLKDEGFFYDHLELEQLEDR
jgi:hypothetical protein